MNNQEAFTTMVKHLLKQNKPCSDEEGSCKYRYNGLKCAVGALIPDDLYTEEMESWGAFALQRNLPLLKDVDPKMLASCQDIHDTHHPIWWDGKLRLIAKDFGLEYEL